MTWLLVVALMSAGQSRPDLAAALERAASLERAGDTSGALAAYRAMLPAAERDDLARSKVLEAVALVETNAGDYESGIRDALAAAAIHDASRNARGQAHALNTAGLASLYAGRYDAAAGYLKRAIALSVSAADDEGRAEQLTNLANVDFFTGRYTDALERYDASLALARAHAGEVWSARRMSLVLVNRAALDQRLGRHEEALAVYRELEAQSGGLRPREQAQIRLNEGVVYRNLGDPAKALAAYDRALDLFARDQQTDARLGVLKNRGIVLALDMGDLDAATRAFSDALAGARAIGNRREALQAQLYLAEARLRAGLVPEARDGFAAGVEQARALGTPEETWKALFGLGRAQLAAGEPRLAARTLASAIDVIEAIRERIRVPILKSDFFNDKRDVYDALIALELPARDPSRLFALVERSHSRAWRERLGLSGAVSLASIQAALPADAALLDFWSSPEGSAVVVVTRDAAHVEPIALDAAAIRDLVDGFDRGPSDAWRDRAAAVAAGLLPRQISERVRRLIVVPDGLLSTVPFEVLPLGSRLLVERAAISYLPTAAMLLRPRPVAAISRAPWRLQLAAFGDPVAAGSELDRPNARLGSSRAEVEAIAHEITGAARLHVGGDDRKAFLNGPDASAPILHVASHAVADSNAVERSRILFSPEAQDRGADYLFLKEAYDLHLDRVDLVVLSACETERGRVRRGDGVQSFSRAFLAAGARSTVTTLWRVADEPTAAFMTVFYRELQRGLSRDEALRVAKLRFIRSGTALGDPHFWGAFVLTGDGVHPVAFPIGWSTLALAATGVLAACCVAWRSSGRKKLFR